MPRNDYEFLRSRIQPIKVLKENPKTKISLVYYEGNEGTAILRICKGRDLSDLCAALMKIRNINIAVLYDYAYFDGDTYILEEYISGDTLDELVQTQGVFSEKDTIRIIISVCNGLKELHSKKPPIIHNDIKMENIMVCADGGVKLFDFDAARTYKVGKDKNTRLLGTEEYAAPEHRGYGQSEPRTDIYSLGVTIHYMLTGCGLDSDHKMSYKGPLKTVIQKCIEIDYKKRYASVQHLMKDLENRLHPWKKVFKILSASGLSFLLLGAAIVFCNNLFSETLDAKEGENKEIQEIVQVELAQEYAENVGITTDIGVDDTLENESGEVIAEDEKAVEDAELGQKVVLKETFEDDEEENKPDEVNSTNDDILEMQTASGKEEVSDGAPIEEKKMEIVGKVEGTLYSVVALNDGTILSLEHIGGDYVVHSSLGQSVILFEDKYFPYGAKLIYNNYTEDLYFLGFVQREMIVYRVTEEMGLEEVARIDENFIGDTVDMTCTFFSDEVLYCNHMFKFIDINNGVVLGSAPAGAGIINDRIYARGIATKPFEEIDEDGNVIKDFPAFDFTFSGHNHKIYYDGKYAYFWGDGSDGKAYLYRFNGQRYEQMICLDEYKYFTDFMYDHLCVTEDVMRCYDVNENVIKEFALK